MPLSAHNNLAFRSPCQHDGLELGAGEVPRAMEQLVRDAHDRKTKKSDWHHTCESRGAPRGRGGQSNALMCTHCRAENNFRFSPPSASHSIPWVYAGNDPQGAALRDAA